MAEPFQITEGQIHVFPTIETEESKIRFNVENLLNLANFDNDLYQKTIFYLDIVLGENILFKFLKDFQLNPYSSNQVVDLNIREDRAKEILPHTINDIKQTIFHIKNFSLLIEQFFEIRNNFKESKFCIDLVISVVINNLIFNSTNPLPILMNINVLKYVSAENIAKLLELYKQHYIETSRVFTELQGSEKHKVIQFILDNKDNNTGLKIANLNLHNSLFAIDYSQILGLINIDIALILKKYVRQSGFHRESYDMILSLAVQAIIRGEVEHIKPYFTEGIWEHFKEEDKDQLLKLLTLRGGTVAKYIIFEQLIDRNILNAEKMEHLIFLSLNELECNSILESLLPHLKKVIIKAFIYHPELEEFVYNDDALEYIVKERIFASRLCIFYINDQASQDMLKEMVEKRCLTLSLVLKLLLQEKLIEEDKEVIISSVKNFIPSMKINNIENTIKDLTRLNVLIRQNILQFGVANLLLQCEQFKLSNLITLLSHDLTATKYFLEKRKKFERKFMDEILSNENHKDLEIKVKLLNEFFKNEPNKEKFIAKYFNELKAFVYENIIENEQIITLLEEKKNKREIKLILSEIIEKEEKEGSCIEESNNDDKPDHDALDDLIAMLENELEINQVIEEIDEIKEKTYLEPLYELVQTPRYVPTHAWVHDIIKLDDGTEVIIKSFYTRGNIQHFVYMLQDGTQVVIKKSSLNSNNSAVKTQSRSIGIKEDSNKEKAKAILDSFKSDKPKSLDFIIAKRDEKILHKNKDQEEYKNSLNHIKQENFKKKAEIIKANYSTLLEDNPYWKEVTIGKNIIFSEDLFIAGKIMEAAEVM